MTTSSASSPRARAWLLALTGIGSLMVALDTLVVALALTTIRGDLGASVAQLEWTVNAYNLSFAVLLIPAAAPRALRGRHRRVHRRVRPLRARPRHRVADRRPGRPGRRRRAGHAARPRPP